MEVGNFLTETYISLRKLENEVLKEYYKSRANNNQIIIKEQIIKVNINQFYGIEINDFGCKVAETALWIAESQMIDETNEILGTTLLEFPLNNNNNIHCKNALRVDWNEIISNNELNYIISNPPFTGKSDRNNVQKEDMKIVFRKDTKLDYVCAWYKKAFSYIEGRKIRVAFVSTNSIAQGEQPYELWNNILGKTIKIDFAYTSFKWESSVKEEASVYCVIIGFSNIDTYNEKYLIDLKNVKNINGYLIDAPNIFLASRTHPLNAPKSIRFGSMPNDGGYLSNYSEYKKNEICLKYPKAIEFFKLIMGAKEFINNKKRWCIWLDDVEPKEYNKIKPIMEAIKNVRNVRENSPRDETRKIANKPMLFAEIRQPNNDFLVIPEVSSEDRKYIPIGFLKRDVIANNRLFTMENGDLYDFGVLSSKVHMAWTNVFCGRLEMRYNYSAKIVYNNFPWANPTDKQKQKIEKTAQNILEARAKYPNSSLGDLYNELTMPIELRNAHQENDKAVMELYGFKNSLTENEIVAKLIDKYIELLNKK